MEVLLSVVFGVFTLVIGICGALYIFLWQRNQYWAKRGVIHEKPRLYYGNFVANKSYRQLFQEFYNKYKKCAPFGGFYLLIRPTIILFDLDLIKNVLIKDFAYFPQRGQYYNEKDDPLSANLVNLEGTKWRKIRSKLTSTFTSGKMKFMLPTLVEVAERFVIVLDDLIKEKHDDNALKKESLDGIDMKELLACFTTDIIGTCAFGLECNSLKDPKTKFRVMSKRAQTAQRHGRLIYAFKQTFPNFARKLGIKNTPDDLSEFFLGIVRETVSYRERENIQRNDFMNLLIELKGNTNDADKGNLSIEEIAAQVYVFFLAGYETSSSTLGFCLYELALNRDMQENARKEIFEMLERHNDVITYEGLRELKYIQHLIQETLRLYTLFNSLVRVAIADYPVANSKFIIEKDTLVLIPINAIHHDADLYPNPYKFDPTRFDLDSTKKRHAMSWLPFGEGPRNCIGLRFGEMQVLIGLVMLLKKFRFTAKRPLELNERSIILSAKNGLFLDIESL